MALQPGDMAPDFSLPATVGDNVTLSDYRGRKSVILRTAFIIGKDGRIADVVASDIPVARDIGGLLDRARAA